MFRAGLRTLAGLVASVAALLPSSAPAQQLSLSWLDNSGGQASFVIQRATGSAGTYGQIAQAPAGTATYTDTSVSLGSTYCYRVAAVNSAGTSAFSNSACGSPSGGFTVTVTETGNGSGTVTSSPAGINCGTACSYTYPSSSAVTLTATPASGSTFGGWSGGGCSGAAPCTMVGNVSASVTAPFTIASVNPVPAISSLAPSSATQGGPAFTLTVTGTGFVPASTVQWNGSMRTTSFVSATQLTASIPASDLAGASTAAVTVVTPAPGGGTAAAATFSIVIPNPVPTLTSIAPTTAPQNGPALSLTVNGSNFIPSSVVQWNGSGRPTTFVGATQLTASIAASDLAAAGPATVTVLTAGPGGGTSSAQAFTVIAPSLTVSASTSVSGGSITATLSNSPGGSTDWLGLSAVASADTSFLQHTDVGAGITSRTWTVTMPAAPGSYEFRLYLNNMYTVAARSAAVTVVNPTPKITSLSPSSVAVGSAAFTLTVSGSGFASGATATVGGQVRAVTVVSATQVRIAVLAGDVASVGNVQVQVTNPGGCVSGGCASNTVNLGVVRNRWRFH